MNTAKKIEFLKATISKIEHCTTEKELKEIEHVVNQTSIWDDGSKTVINARIADVRYIFSIQNL